MRRNATRAHSDRTDFFTSVATLDPDIQHGLARLNQDMRVLYMRHFIVLLVFTLFATLAQAQPPEHADPALAPWFQSLRAPGSGIGCCSQSDCRPVETRFTKEGHWEVLVDTQFNVEGMPPVVPHWLEVPPSHVLLRHDNPVGRAVACWHRIYVMGFMEQQGEIICFIPPFLS